MSRYYGVVQGNRGEAHRGGSSSSGLSTTCASWHGSVCCHAYELDGKDMVTVKLEPWQGKGVHLLVFDGPFDGNGESLLESSAMMLSAYLRMKGCSDEQIRDALHKLTQIAQKERLLEGV
jgi:hypothetical protein